MEITVIGKYKLTIDYIKPVDIVFKRRKNTFLENTIFRFGEKLKAIKLYFNILKLFFVLIDDRPVHAVQCFRLETLTY